MKIDKKVLFEKFLSEVPQEQRHGKQSRCRWTSVMEEAVRLRYGIGYQPMSPKQIAEALGLVHCRITFLLSQAERICKSYCREREEKMAKKQNRARLRSYFIAPQRYCSIVDAMCEVTAVMNDIRKLPPGETRELSLRLLSMSFPFVQTSEFREFLEDFRDSLPSQ